MNKRPVRRQLASTSGTTSIESRFLDDESSLLLVFSKGAKTRRRIIATLQTRLLNCNQIASELDLDWWTVAKHLEYLKQSGLIRCMNVGRIRFYKVTPKGESISNSQLLSSIDSTISNNNDNSVNRGPNF